MARKILRIVVDPHHSLTDHASRRGAFILSVSLLTMICVFAGYDIVNTYAHATYAVPIQGYALLAVAYVLSRTRRYMFAAYTVTAMFPLVIFPGIVMSSLPHPDASLHFLLLGVIFTSLFATITHLLWYAAAVTAATALVPLLGIPPLDTIHAVMSPLVTLVIGSLFVILVIYHRGATERERQSHFEDSTHRLESALGAGLTAAWDWDLVKNSIVWSGGAGALFATDGRDLGNSFESFLRFVHPDDISFVESTSQRLMTEAEDLQPGEFRIVQKNGSVRWISSVGKALRDRDGHAIRLVGMLSDITERVESKRALERQVRELRALSRIGFTCTEAKSIDELVSNVTEIVGSTLYPDNFGFLLVRKEEQVLRHHPSFRIQPGQTALRDIPLGEGISGWVVRNASARRVGNTASAPDYLQLATGMLSELCVPIKVGNEVIGVIDAERAAYDAFSEEDEQLLTTIASEVSVAAARIETQYQLRSKEELLARTQSLAHLGTWEWDLHTNKTTWSDELARMFGEGSGGDYPFDLSRLHPEDRPIVESSLRNGLETGVIPQVEVRALRKDGRYRTILAQGSVMKDAKGIPVKVLGTALDISDVRQAEDKFLKAFHAIHDAMVIVSLPAGEFIEVNDGFTRLSGFTRNEVIGKTLSQLGMWADAADELRFREEMSNESGLKNFAVELYDKDRNVRSCLISAERIEMEGRPCAVTMTRDITDRKLLEERLLQSQKMESIGRLAGGIAHDFNNYLSAILGYADMAEKRAVDERLKGYLQNIKNASDKAAHLTRQLLAFARKQIIAPKVVSLNEVVEAAEKMLRRLIREDTDLSVRLDPKTPHVRIDPNQFEQVLINLVVNAKDALEGGGRISIATSAIHLPPGDPRRRPDQKTDLHASLSVSDSGTGISEETLDHIFEPFFTTKSSDKGTGLGLATCLGIVEQHHGTIYVERTSKKGTTFRVLLPAVGSTDKIEQAEDQRAKPGGTESILFVEDEHMVRDIGVETLRDLGYKVFPAANGPEALLFVTTSKENVDILVTDVVMPRMSGRELAEHVLKLRPGIKLLYTSGYNESIISEQGVLRSGVTLLQKPYSPLELAIQVRESLDRPAG